MPLIIFGSIVTIGWLILALICFITAADIAPGYPGVEAAPLPRLFYELRAGQAFEVGMLGFGCIGLAILTAMMIYIITLLRGRGRAGTAVADGSPRAALQPANVGPAPYPADAGPGGR